MLRELFPRSGEKYWRSQFGPELQDFCRWLDAAGYSELNIRGHLRRLFKVLSESRSVAGSWSEVKAVPASSIRAVLHMH